jgi:ArsR family transcriptional regulator, arsenate/arsenite/antimonite-responsive transcriptional repressor
MENIPIKHLDRAVKVSADINRIRILSMLKIKKMCVCEIACVLNITQPSVSRHLRKLKNAGFIESEDEKLWTNYYLCPRNPYARNFVKNLDVWLADDSLINRDKEKARKADRKNLCGG